jgi:hypothetical protein
MTFYTKKGNKVVIMSWTEYEKLTEKKTNQISK